MDSIATRNSVPVGGRVRAIRYARSICRAGSSPASFFTRSANRGFDAAAGGGEPVAPDLGVAPLSGEPPQILVLWILFTVSRGVVRGGHLVRLGRHDQPVQLLDAPPAIHEFDRQIVQQFRM